MNVAVQGTKNFIEYNVFMRAMGVALSSIADDKEFNRFLYFTDVTDKERSQDYRVNVPEVASYYEQYYPIKEI